MEDKSDYPTSSQLPDPKLSSTLLSSESNCQPTYLTKPQSELYQDGVLCDAPESQSPITYQSCTINIYNGGQISTPSPLSLQSFQNSTQVNNNFQGVLTNTTINIPNSTSSTESERGTPPWWLPRWLPVPLAIIVVVLLFITWSILGLCWGTNGGNQYCPLLIKILRHHLLTISVHNAEQSWMKEISNLAQDAIAQIPPSPTNLNLSSNGLSTNSPLDTNPPRELYPIPVSNLSVTIPDDIRQAIAARYQCMNSFISRGFGGNVFNAHDQQEASQCLILDLSIDSEHKGIPDQNFEQATLRVLNRRDAVEIIGEPVLVKSDSPSRYTIGLHLWWHLKDFQNDSDTNIDSWCEYQELTLENYPSQISQQSQWWITNLANQHEEQCITNTNLNRAY